MTSSLEESIPASCFLSSTDVGRIQAASSGCVLIAVSFRSLRDFLNPNPFNMFTACCGPDMVVLDRAPSNFTHFSQLSSSDDVLSDAASHEDPAFALSVR